MIQQLFQLDENILYMCRMIEENIRTQDYNTAKLSIKTSTKNLELTEWKIIFNTHMYVHLFTDWLE